MPKQTKTAPTRTRSPRKLTAPTASQAVSVPTTPTGFALTLPELTALLAHLNKVGFPTTPIAPEPTSAPETAKPAKRARKAAAAPEPTSAPETAKPAKASNGLSFANALSSLATRFAIDITRATIKAGVSFDGTGWLIEADKSATDAIELVLVGEHSARAAKFAHVWLRAQRDVRQITTPYKGASGELRISAQLTRASVAL